MKFTYDINTRIYSGTAPDNTDLPNSTFSVPLLSNEKNIMRFMADGWVEISQEESKQIKNDYLESLKTLDDYKSEKIAVIRQKEIDKINSGITYNSHKIDSDDKAQKFLTSLMTAVNAGVITGLEGFTTFDGVDITLTANDIVNISGLLLIHVATCHAWKRAKYSLVDAAATREQLEAIVVND